MSLFFDDVGLGDGVVVDVSCGHSVKEPVIKPKTEF